VPICRLTVRVPPSNLIHEYPQFSAISRFQSHGLPELRVTAVNPDSITFPRTIDKIDRHAFTAKRDDQPIENRWVIPGGPVLTFLSPQPRSRVEMDFAPTFADFLEEPAPSDAFWKQRPAFAIPGPPSMRSSSMADGGLCTPSGVHARLHHCVCSPSRSGNRSQMVYPGIGR
jgi:hypothetical protein